MPKKPRKLPYLKEMDFEVAATRISEIIGAINLLGTLLMTDEEFLDRLSGSRMRGKIEQCARELWNTSEKLEEALRIVRKKVPKSH